jgi:hypothetical protein
MRLGFAPFRGSNPRASAPEQHFAEMTKCLAWCRPGAADAARHRRAGRQGRQGGRREFRDQLLSPSLRDLEELPHVEARPAGQARRPLTDGLHQALEVIICSSRGTHWFESTRPYGGPVSRCPAGYGSGMDSSVITQLGAIVTAEGSRQERAALAAGLVRRATGARWAGTYKVTDAVVTWKATAPGPSAAPPSWTASAWPTPCVRSGPAAPPVADTVVAPSAH